MSKHALRSALGVVAILSGLASAQAAQKTYLTKDAPGTGTLTWCAFDAGSFGIASCHIPVSSSGAELFTPTNPGSVGLAFGSANLTLGPKAKTGSLPMVGPTDPDTTFASGPITAVDAGSTTATGQNSVSLISGTPTAAAVYSQAINGQAETVFTVTGTFAGTLQFEGSGNSGTTYSPRATHLLGTGYVLTTATAPGVYHMNTAGLTNVRVRATAWTSGTATVQAQSTAGTGSVYVMNPQRIIDNVTGKQIGVKAGGAATTSDDAAIVQDPTVAAAIANTAVQTTAPGTAATQAVPMQGVPSGIPVPVSGMVTTQSSIVNNTTYYLGAAAASTNATNFASVSKRLASIQVCSAAAAVRYLKIFDKATAPVPGTDTAKKSIPIPAGGCLDKDWSGGYTLANGLGIAITAGSSLTDATAVSAGDLVGLNIDTN